MGRKASGLIVERKRERGRVYGLRFQAYGKRRYLTLPDGTTRYQAEAELRHVLADVERGKWRPPRGKAQPVEPEGPDDPTFRDFARRW